MFRVQIVFYLNSEDQPPKRTLLNGIYYLTVYINARYFSTFIFNAETCSCQGSFKTNWWELTPYTKNKDGDSTGIFPSILQKAINMCCKECAENMSPKIHFARTDSSKGLQNGILEVSQNINDDIDLHFPIYGAKSQTTYRNSFPYVPLVQSPGAAFIVSSANNYKESKRILNIVLSYWPLSIVILFASYFVGLIMWLLVSPCRLHEYNYIFVIFFSFC